MQSDRDRMGKTGMGDGLTRLRADPESVLRPRAPGDAGKKAYLEAVEGSKCQRVTPQETRGVGGYGQKHSVMLKELELVPSRDWSQGDGAGEGLRRQLIISSAAQSAVKGQGSTEALGAVKPRLEQRDPGRGPVSQLTAKGFSALRTCKRSGRTPEEGDTENAADAGNGNIAGRFAGK
ncbi:unnamed protein product [Gadus morhua 'NCC']